jgi:aryl-alcohol dehydrogenase-like predicted oxidoreductase
VARLGLTGRHVPSALRGSVSRQDFSPSYIASAIEASLRRLRTDYIDVYQLHSPPPDVLRAGAFVETLERSREQGKIRYWGVACEHPEDVADCLAHAQIASVQVGFSALEQAALDSAIPQAARRGIGIISRQVYASGLLTRPIDAFEPCQIDDDTAVADRKREQIAALSAIAANTRRSRAELALKFALSQADVSVVLLGISRQAHLDDCLAALQTPDLTEQEQQMVMSARRPGR